jgi:hypothetical protein
MLDASKMDSEEKELWEMLTSKFEKKELIRVLELIAIDSKKHQKEQLLNSRLSIPPIDIYCKARACELPSQFEEWLESKTHAH